MRTLEAQDIRTMRADLLVEHLFRHQAARIIAALTRVFGSHNLQLAEDVVQDALIKALAAHPVADLETERPSLEEVFLTLYES